MANQLSISELFTPATQTQWLDQELSNCNTLQLSTSSWQSGGMCLTILEVFSYILSEQDAIVSTMAQGGFLDFAANGSVTYTAADGTVVTTLVSPDPSIPGQNPLGQTTWLDALSTSVYNVTRIGSTPASGNMLIANATSSTYNYNSGTYHVSNPVSAASYSNTASLAIVPSATAGGTITGVTTGPPAVVTTNVAHGLLTGAYVYIAGVQGISGINGFAQITLVSTTQFSLNGVTGVGSWSSGGVVYVPQIAAFAADAAGPAGTSGVGAITQAVTANTGVAVWNPAQFIGLPWETNNALVARCRAKLQSLSPNGPTGAYAYFATSASTYLAAENPPVSLSSAITKALVTQSYSTGVVTTYVANAAGAVLGCSNLAVTGATNATPIKITTASSHGLSTNNFATIAGVQGNTSANGTWLITVNSPTQFSLVGSVGNANYTSGGTVDGGDLGQVDTVIQNYAVPDSVTAVTASATGWNVNITATVAVSSAFVSQYQSAVQTALAMYFAPLPIGGGTNTSIQYNEISGVLYAAGVVAGGGSSSVKSIPSMTINGSSTNVPFPSSTSVAVLNPAPSITVIGV